MLVKDAWRSFAFITLAAALIFWYVKSSKTDRQESGKFTAAAICLCLLFVLDLFPVDKRYLNGDHFVSEREFSNQFTERPVDKIILEDKSLDYRVLDLSVNTFNDSHASYRHKSIGGYSPAKIQRYQDLIDHRLQNEINSIIGTFQNVKSAADFLPVFAACPSLNMLNTRYIIYNPGQPPLVNPYANGNAWFVREVREVENPDAEIAALNEIDPKQTAVVDNRFAAQLAGFVPQPDSTATIQLTSYRPNKLIYKTKASTEQVAVFSEIYYQPGWQATIDGQPADHFRADWILRAMRVPAGEHEIVFEFRPTGYIVAANVETYSSFLILLLLLGAVGYSIYKAVKKAE